MTGNNGIPVETRYANQKMDTNIPLARLTIEKPIAARKIIRSMDVMNRSSGTGVSLVGNA
ncbi:MAG: hypothetical protein NVSMB9_00340 [Isosphaeraceae bacterium]